jgi:hypothetical protein
MAELEKVKKEKLTLEGQLVHYKLKYAENCAKIMELEDNNIIQKRKLDVSFINIEHNGTL